VTLSQLSRAAVEAAIDHFDQVGRETFLRETGFGRSRSYFLRRGESLYDSKAIAGYAHGISVGTPLGAGDFSGGDKSVAQRLEALDFEVAYLPPIDWSRDEIILACAAVESNGWKQLDRDDPRAADLSSLLQSPAIHPPDTRNPDFRNRAGVARKTADIATHHPHYRGRPTNGNRLDEEVLHEFIAHPENMRQLAEAIREELAAGQPAEITLSDIDLDEPGTWEGSVLYRRHLRRERDPRVRQKKINDAKRRGQPIVCEVCRFDFAQIYGARGIDYIECHHRTPLHVSGPTLTRLEDLALLCSNCHRMIHRGAPWLTVEDLRTIVADQLVTS
jgi:5-methylcytosine-specific restriction protein A